MPISLLVPGVLELSVLLRRLLWRSTHVLGMEAAANDTQQTYRIAPGGSLSIRRTFHPEMNQEELVRPDGKISALLVGDVKENDVTGRKINLQKVVVNGAKEQISLAPHDGVFVPRTAVANANIWVRQHTTDLIPFARPRVPGY